MRSDCWSIDLGMEMGLEVKSKLALYHMRKPSYPLFRIDVCDFNRRSADASVVVRVADRLDLSRTLERDAHQYSNGGSNVQMVPLSVVFFPFNIKVRRQWLQMVGVSEQVLSKIILTLPNSVFPNYLMSPPFQKHQCEPQGLQ